jgi:cell division cycle 20-like protein 1 (cofactor of APC complex)
MSSTPAGANMYDHATITQDARSPCQRRSGTAGEVDAQTLAGNVQYEQLIQAECFDNLHPDETPQTPRKRSVRTLDFLTPSKRRPQSRAGSHKQSFSNSIFSTMPISPWSQKLLTTPRSRHREISKHPFKVLDAPDLQDDFYLNLVDWGESNILSVGLASCVYLWAANSSKVTKLCDLVTDEDKVTSVAWNKKGDNLSVGMCTYSYKKLRHQ